MSRAPETRRVCVLSTAHLMAATINHLNATALPEWPVAGGRLPFGFYIYVHDAGENEHPADLEACFGFIRGTGAQRVIDGSTQPAQAMSPLCRSTYAT